MEQKFILGYYFIKFNIPKVLYLFFVNSSLDKNLNEIVKVNSLIFYNLKE